MSAAICPTMFRRLERFQDLTFLLEGQVIEAGPHQLAVKLDLVGHSVAGPRALGVPRTAAYSPSQSVHACGAYCSYL